MVLRSLRRSNTVPTNNFSCAVRERYHLWKNFGGWQFPGLPVPGCGSGQWRSQPRILEGPKYL